MKHFFADHILFLQGESNGHFRLENESFGFFFDFQDLDAGVRFVESRVTAATPGRRRIEAMVLDDVIDGPAVAGTERVDTEHR